jgi:hypothetical protein
MSRKITSVNLGSNSTIASDYFFPGLNLDIIPMWRVFMKIEEKGGCAGHISTDV